MTSKQLTPIGEVNKAGFEIEACGRCGGSGRYSYNAINGDRCFGCGGAGKCLTKRGAAARAFFMGLLEKPVAEVQAGDNVYTSATMTGPDVWNFVTSIGPDHGVCYPGEKFGDRYRIDLKRNGRAHSLGGLSADHRVRSVRTEEERLAKLAAAVAHQATLTKTGKPPAQRKRAAAAA